MWVADYRDWKKDSKFFGGSRGRSEEKKKKQSIKGESKDNELSKDE